MEQRIKLVGDGTPQGTRVEVDGKPLDNVERAMYCVSVDGTAWLTLELSSGVAIELDVVAKQRESDGESPG